MKQYGMWKAIFMSFYSRKLYRDVAVNWGGYAFVYLLFIIALSWIVFTYQAQVMTNQLYAANSDVIVEQIPVVTITKGKISTPEQRPYVIMDKEKKEKLFIIDTTGKYKTLDEAGTPVLITDTQIISRTKPNEIKQNTLPASISFVIDPVVVNDYAKSYLSYLWVLMFPIMVLLTFIYRFIQVLLYSIIGKILALISGVRIGYAQIMLVTMVALTPVIAVCTILYALDIVFPYQMLTYFLLAMAYMWYGILANKQQGY